MYNKDSNNGKMYYIHKDHLGSVNVISDENGEVVEEHSFDAWGRRRNAENWTYSDIEDEHITDRGYTGHEHLDRFGIINMNGRVYDPIIGRFLSPDKFVQAPQSTKSFNRYSYCMNNPLNTTDPSGWVGGNTSGGGGEGNWSSGLYGADGMTNSQWMYNSSPNRSNTHYRAIYNMQNPSAAKQNNVSIRVYTHTTTSTKTGNDGLLVTVGTKHYKVIDFATYNSKDFISDNTYVNTRFYDVSRYQRIDQIFGNIYYDIASKGRGANYGKAIIVRYSKEWISMWGVSGGDFNTPKSWDAFWSALQTTVGIIDEHTVPLAPIYEYTPPVTPVTPDTIPAPFHGDMDQFNLVYPDSIINVNPTTNSWGKPDTIRIRLK